MLPCRIVAPRGSQLGKVQAASSLLLNICNRTDKSGSNTAALNNINRGYKPNFQIKIRQNKYINNMIEQDHRFIKKMYKPMLGFYSLKSARATLAGIELHHMLRKGQHKTLHNKPIWEQFCSLAG